MVDPQRVCLVNDSSVNPNWGCRATSFALKQLIRDTGSEITAIIDLNQLLYLSLSDRRSWDRTLRVLRPLAPRRPLFREVVRRGVDRVRDKLPDVVPRTLEEFEPFSRSLVRGDILAYAGNAFRNCDAVIVNGEGGIYGFKREARLMLFLAYVAKRHFGLQVALVNHTAVLSDPRLKAMAAAVYPLLDDVVFREPESVNANKDIVDGNLAPDAAFCFRPARDAAWREVASAASYYSVWPDSADFNVSAPFVAVGGSALLNGQGKGDDLVKGIKALVRALQSRVGPVVLTASDVPDEVVLRKVAVELCLPLIGLHVPVQQAVDVLGNAVAYVGGRWHSCIFSALGGTPFVPLGTHGHKLNGLSAMYQLPNAGVDPYTLSRNFEEVVDVVEDHVSAGEKLRSRLKSVSEGLRPQVKRHVQILDHGNVELAVQELHP